MTRPVAPSVDLIVERLAEIRSRIALIQRPFEHEVEIVAVTKGFGVDAIINAAEAGCGWIGENYAQELVGKHAELNEMPVRVQFIGHLQSNKVRQLAGIVDVWASLDRTSVVEEVARRCPGASVFIQVNAVPSSAGVANEKSGCAPDDVGRLIELARKSGLVVEGLMTVGPTNADPEVTSVAFATVRRLVDEHGLTECSMGMSGDLAIAVAHGSTQLRVGTALFGPRSP
jgi:pyridoxal phosphate enzyme (YggS family)